MSLVLAVALACALAAPALAAGVTVSEVVPFRYDEAWRGFSEGLAAVGRNGKTGFIDRAGKEVIPCQYNAATSFSEGLAGVSDGYIDAAGKMVLPFQGYGDVAPFIEGLAAVCLNDKYGFIDKTGKVVIPCQYNSAGFFSEGLAAVAADKGKRDDWGGVVSQWGFIDKTGKEVVPCKYDSVRNFSEGLAAVRKNGKYGYIDKTGQEVISCKYDDARSFSNGLAAVKLNGKYGYIDKTGKEVVPCKYENAYPFSEGMAAVQQNDKWGFLAINGYVPLVLNGGSGVDYIIADASGVLNVPQNPTKAGYTFGGWYSDAALTTPWNFNNKVVSGLTLYAKWVPVSSTAATTGKSQSVISLNGQRVTLDAYSLKAANGGDVTYVKLRDIAALLEKTSAKFNVDWKRGAIYVTTKSAYTTKNGGELKAIVGADGSYKWNTAPVLFDGTTKALEGIVITDANGGGHTFFKLRDLGEAIGFGVGWSAERGIYIETK